MQQLGIPFEQWRPVVGYEGRYEVSNMGRVRSVDHMVRLGEGWKGGRDRLVRGRVLHQQPGPRGNYLTVVLGHADRRLVHRLVLEAFVGPCPEGLECCHGPSGQLDNRLSNLRWDTEEANIADRKLHGSQRGARNNCAKLSEDDVRSIRSLSAGGMPRTEVARRFRVSPSNVKLIVARKTWSHLN